MMKLVSIAAATAALALVATPAAAATLLGQTVGIQYIFPNTTTVYSDLGTNLVGTDGPTDGIGYFDLSFSDTSITADFKSEATWSGADFNGFRVYDVNDAITAITSVSLLSTNMVGLDLSRITFDANNIYVNWNGLAFNNDTIVTLGVNAAVPEPATWAMMIAGFGLVGAAMRRKAMLAA
ncbi:hypothetical protein GCM10011529_00410 [Polymorphobacter glacialis]|uniref:Ice-binding protein C-terminal domain-containing protein n=1 Tax=Sandarakinorhabdus glacialis TaxID=1614636 RepID=A0A917E3M1_9SPHN|nr:PEPxxWA-CTERM sorting domain-containing protein [Polymorphobacter glacialis]GGD98290.1 hypothetical protein GCM10011529_00410 [Polymorphobacter glacialis]